MVTINDIAKRAGVAKSTVSNALTNKKYVSEPLKERIFRICEELDYTPNFYASKLSGSKTGIIALFLEQKQKFHRYYSDLITSCLQTVSEHGYSLLIYYNLDAKQYQNILKNGKAPIDGAIVLAPEMQDLRITHIESNSIPCVVIGKADSESEMSFVDVNNEKIVEDAVNLLYSGGYKTICLINSNKHLKISDERQTAFNRIKNELSLSPESCVLCSETSSSSDGKTFALERIKRGTAFITADTTLAEGVYEAAAECGLEIGKDVGVFSLGGTKDAGKTPNLANASQNYNLLARLASECLVDQITKLYDGEIPETSVTLIDSEVNLDTSVNFIQ
ncbi:MAG: LacI family transcriptional regulator [Clostridia bacterium]|nr:LacI family transcriptional regulator [Clostridia bacterium]